MAEKITVKSGIEPKSRKEPKSVQHNCNHQHKTQQSINGTETTVGFYADDCNCAVHY